MDRKLTIWDAFCQPNWRNGYRRMLKAKGYSQSKIETIMYQFGVYVSRIKASPLAQKLATIDSRKDFSIQLSIIFNNLWKDNIKDNYREIPDHLLTYLNEYLDCAQAIHGEFFNDEEEAMFGKYNALQSELTKYEIDYIKDGSLQALMNPQLLNLLRISMDKQDCSFRKLPSICYNYYAITLPDMKPADFRTLIKDVWSAKGRVSTGTRNKAIAITYPDDRVEIYDSLNALIAIVNYYGFENVLAKHPFIRKRDLLKRYVVSSVEYDLINDSQYICNLGNLTDRRNIANAINVLFNRKLKIDLVEDK